MQLASFGDIAFQLVIFFILSSTFAKEPQGKLELPKSPTLEILGEAEVFVLIDQDGQLWLNQYEVDTPKEIELGVTALLDGIEEPDKRIVHFKCHHEANRNVFEPVIDSLAKAGAMIAIVGEEGVPSSIAD
jgi:biopolymer transport protein ExbD